MLKSNKKLLVTGATLLVTGALLVVTRKPSSVRSDESSFSSGRGRSFRLRGDRQVPHGTDGAQCLSAKAEGREVTRASVKSVKLKRTKLLASTTRKQETNLLPHCY